MNNSKSMKRILMYIDATVVLHNMLLQFGGDSVCDEWETDEVLTAIDAKDRIPEEDILGLPIPDGAPAGTRHEQLKEYIRETYVPQHNFRPMDKIVLDDKVSYDLFSDSEDNCI